MWLLQVSQSPHPHPHPLIYQDLEPPCIEPNFTSLEEALSDPTYQLDSQKMEPPTERPFFSLSFFTPSPPYSVTLSNWEPLHWPAGRRATYTECTLLEGRVPGPCYGWDLVQTGTRHWSDDYPPQSVFYSFTSTSIHSILSRGYSLVKHNVCWKGGRSLPCCYGCGWRERIRVWWDLVMRGSSVSHGNGFALFGASFILPPLRVQSKRKRVGKCGFESRQRGSFPVGQLSS